jgi:hypothetical protein
MTAFPLPDPAAQAAADLANMHRPTGTAARMLFNPVTPAETRAAGEALLHPPNGNGHGRPGQIPTPEEFAQMTKAAKKRKKLRADGTPREENNTPMRSFRASPATWGLVQAHAKAKGLDMSSWLRHAIERMAVEEDRQASYAGKRKPAAKKPAAKKPAAKKPAAKKPAAKKPAPLHAA